MIKVQNIHGYGDIKRYAVGTVGVNLNIKVDNYVIKWFVPFSNTERYIQAVTDNKKLLVFKVESFSKESIELSLVDNLEFTINDHVSIFSENILLHQYGLSGIYTVYNLLNTKKPLYRTRAKSIFSNRFDMGNDSIALTFRENGNNMIFIKDGVLQKVVKSIGYSYAS